MKKLSLKRVLKHILETTSTNLEPYFTSGGEMEHPPVGDVTDDSVMAKGPDEIEEDAEHSDHLTKMNTVRGWGKGNDVRSWLAVGKHAGYMNHGDAWPEAQDELGWEDNERSEHQRNN